MHDRDFSFPGAGKYLPKPSFRLRWGNKVRKYCARLKPGVNWGATTMNRKEWKELCFSR